MAQEENADQPPEGFQMMLEAPLPGERVARTGGQEFESDFRNLMNMQQMGF